MAKNNLISIHCFGQEVGRLGFDPQRSASFFQYNEAFLEQGQYTRMFPLIFRHIRQTQVFDKYNNDTFRGLPPMIADSLPDLFGNIIFKTWMETQKRDMKEISVLEQLAYVGTRGMGALEYQPSRFISAQDTINISEITEIVRQVLDQKTHTHAHRLDHASLLNIFKMGTSAGGMRPKILIAEEKATGNIIPGDIVSDERYDHYLLKLGIDDAASYSKERLEYTYYLAATQAGITMMPSKMIDHKHFATLRFDRQEGKKWHVLTAGGISGWDYMDPQVSSYENLFELTLFLKCPHRDIEQLFRRMVFNLVFANHDDHLKNQSFIYNDADNSWSLAPAYDLTYSLNPELNIRTRSRALSVNGKRTAIETSDLRILAEKYSVKNFKGIVSEIQDNVAFWEQMVRQEGISGRITGTIKQQFNYFAL